MASILIIGQGKLGLPLAHLLSTTHHISTIRRTSYQHTTNHTSNFLIQSIDITEPFELTQTIFDYVFFIVSPNESTDYSYQATYVNGLIHTLAAISHINKRLFIVSSTRVYGDSTEFQHEQSPVNPSDKKAKLLYEMEQLGLNSGYPCSIIRFSGLYESHSQRMRKIMRNIANYQQPWPELSYTNRFHYTDAIHLLQTLLSYTEKNQPLASIYLGTDNDCITNHQLIQFLANQENIDLPTAPHTKKIKGKKLHSLLINQIIKLTYPSYQTGYKIN